MMRSHPVRNTLIALGFGCLMLGAASANAAGNGLGKIDTNHDGMISEQEWLDAAKLRFEKLDTNHDGMLDRQELSNLRQQFREKWQQRNGANAPAQGG